jgi:hypothetical protein
MNLFAATVKPSLSRSSAPRLEGVCEGDGRFDGVGARSIAAPREGARGVASTSKSEGTEERTEDFDGERLLRVRMLPEELGRSSAIYDFAGDLDGDLSGEPLSVLARLRLGVCVVLLSRSSRTCCLPGELLNVLARLLFGVGAAAASTKSSIRFLTGDFLSGLLRSFKAAFFPDSTLIADWGTFSSSSSSNFCLAGVAVILGAIFSWLSGSTFSRNGLEGPSS